MIDQWKMRSGYNERLIMETWNMSGDNTKIKEFHSRCFIRTEHKAHCTETALQDEPTEHIQWL